MSELPPETLLAVISAAVVSYEEAEAAEAEEEKKA
jgi:hypothetical protein